MGKGGYTRKADHPRRFAFVVTFWVVLSVASVLAALFNVYARIHHLPRCGNC